jgi:uncharacterized membrane protein
MSAVFEKGEKMNNQSQEQIKKYLAEKFDTLSKREQDFVHRIIDRKHITRDTNKEYDDQLTFGQRVADKVAAFGGSWTFIILFALILLT